ncbi:hypothetical protein MSG28_012132 [Choristoneura fumiferana]|uniref:Uncharacterized protein n=1 Tax=Choristoneura fumiferana TaxID=7141 RepID=A0ACC0KD44_CHOFU|nr:hypothetical protein MSG28_012132 [Choristoneura fumiferana]
MRCSITELFNAFPITSKEKDDLSCCPEKERSPQLAHKTVGQLNNGVAQVVIVAGATGCGKTTQLPQLVLEAWQARAQPARIYCTQPRRLSAVSVAERITQYRNNKMAAAERDLRHKLHTGDSYWSRLEGADPLVCDASGKTARDYALAGGHAATAALLASLAPPQDTHNAAKDEAADRFLLDVYHHTVSEDFIDHDLMLALIKHIHINLPKGSILIFLPGYDDIVTLRDLVQNCTEMNALKYQIFTLHSNMQTLDQKKVFNPLPNARKIIISTNIAETSITIDDVVYVVDSCKVKEKYYESSGGVCSLQCVWTSRAGCQQRAGRAGRTKPGHCFHLCSKRRFQTLPLNSIPEILRVPLQELCLHTKLLAPGNTPIADFLSKALEPPSFLAVRNAVTLLKTIGALTPMEDLTEIGQHLLDLTVEPKLGKMLLYACVMKCLDPILTIVCSLANKEPFQISMNPENRKRGSVARKEFAADCYSDHMALLRAFQAWQSARANGSERAFCAKNLICGATMEMIVGYRAQLLAQLRALCLVKARGSGDIKDVNLNSEKWHVVKAVLVSGLYPSIARVDRDSSTLRTFKEVKVAFHPSSTLHRGDGIAGSHKSVQNLPTDWVVFEEISRAGRFCFIRCNTLVTPLTIALFGGPLRLPPGALTQRANPPGLSSDSDSEADENNSSPDTAVLTLDEWMAFTADASDAISVYYLRQKLCALVIRRMSNPAKPMTPLDEQILSTCVHVLAAEEKNVGGAPPRPRLAAPPPPGPAARPVSPNGKTLLANIEKYSEVGDSNARYFVARADEAGEAAGGAPFAAATLTKLHKIKQYDALLDIVLLFLGLKLLQRQQGDAELVLARERLRHLTQPALADLKWGVETYNFLQAGWKDGGFSVCMIPVYALYREPTCTETPKWADSVIGFQMLGKKQLECLSRLYSVKYVAGHTFTT